jgi:hypothetical protein
MTKISLKEFCLTGHFGKVRIGMNISEVKEILGEPDHEQDFETGSSGIMYAWYEFFYWTETKILYAIQNDHLMTWPNLIGKEKVEEHRKEITFENSQCRIETWFLSPGKSFTYGQVIEICRAEKINIREFIDEYGGPIIEFESGVRFDFDDGSSWFFKDKNGDTVENKYIITNIDDQILDGVRFFVV